MPTNNSGILKKYFLEVAIVSIWADKRVEGNETEFPNRLGLCLLFSDDDLQNSMSGVEGFVLDH